MTGHRGKAHSGSLSFVRNRFGFNSIFSGGSFQGGKTPLALKKIEARVKVVADRTVFARDFIFELLFAFGRNTGNLTRLRSASASSLNVAADPRTEVAQQGVLYLTDVPRGSEADHL